MENSNLYPLEGFNLQESFCDFVVMTSRHGGNDEVEEFIELQGKATTVNIAKHHISKVQRRLWQNKSEP